MLSLRRCLFTVSLSLLASCSFTNDFERFSFPEPDSGPPVYVPLACAAMTLVEGVGVELDTTGQGDDFMSTCGGGGSADVLVEFVAPTTTYYRITTEGSAIDTVLSVLDPVCETSTELSCNNDDGILPTSELLLPLTEGQRILIVADGNASEGAVRLRAERIACPSTVLALDTPINHTTVGRPDEHPASCGGSSGGDNAYRFVAPEDGFYSFLATKVLSTTRTVVSVEDGAECGGELLQCNYGQDGRSEVIRFLRAQQVVTVWVDAFDATQSGTYSLVASRRPDQICAESGEFNSAVPTMTTIAKTDAHNFSTSCASTSVWWFGGTDPAEIQNFPDRSYSFNMPENANGCSFLKTITITAGFQFAAAIVEGNTCGGPEIACYGGPTQSDVGGIPQWQQVIQLQGVPAGTPVERTIIIDRILRDIQGGVILDPSTDVLTIEVSESGIC